jgi:hypothetical protein
MHTFLKLNKRKLRYAFTFCAVSFSSLALLVLSIGWFATGNSPKLSLVAAILLFTIILFPAFAIFVGYLAWFIRRASRNKAFSKSPFSELGKIGFTTSLKEEHSKLHFTEEVQEGKINGFTIRCDLPEGNANSIEFEVLHVFRKPDKIEFERVENLLTHYNGYFKAENIAISYKLKKTKALSLENVENDLQQFTAMLKQIFS